MGVALNSLQTSTAMMKMMICQDCKVDKMEKRKDILLDNDRMAFFQSGRDHHVHQAPLKDDILFKLSSLVVVGLVLRCLHGLAFLFPRVSYGLDNVLECD